MGDDVAGEAVVVGPLPKVTWAEMAREKYLSAMAWSRSSTCCRKRLAGVDLMTRDPDVHHFSSSRGRAD
jgi:hypothetical protein